MKRFWVTIFRLAIGVGAIAVALSSHAQSMFRGDPAHSGHSVLRSRPIDS
jgi:hypothetical protein